MGTTILWILLGLNALLFIIFLSRIIRFKKKDGVLFISQADPEKDIYRIVVEDLDKINNKKYIILKVLKE